MTEGESVLVGDKLGMGVFVKAIVEETLGEIVAGGDSMAEREQAIVRSKRKVVSIIADFIIS